MINLNFKKILILFFLVLTELIAFSQMPTDGNYSDWDWENQDQTNWKSKYGNIWVDINPPFAPQTERLGLMVQIDESGDYTKAKGWHLLWAQFDGDYPYFILYNTHKSIVRVFFYLEQTPFTDILATLSFYDVTNPGVLSYADEYQSSTQDYYNNTTNSDNDMIAVVIRNVGVRNWGAADFPILFDNNITDNSFQNKKWKFQFFGCNNYQIHLDGTTSTDPAQLEQHTISTSKTSLTSNTFNADYSKLHKEIQSIDKYLLEMQNSVRNIDTNSAPFLQNYKSVVKGLKGLSTIASVVSGISSAFGAVLSFANIVYGTFGESESTKPLATTQYLKLEGSMTINQALGGTTLSIPGVVGTYYPNNLLWQPFNCPMGTINLKTTPHIKATTPYNKYGFYDSDMSFGYNNGVITYLFGIDGFPTLIATGTHSVVSSYPVKYPGKILKYKFDDDIELTSQEINGLQLIDVNVAIICKANGIGDRKYKIYDKYLAYHRFYNMQGQEFHLPLDNPVYKALVEGRFIIHKFDEEKDAVYFGTPYMDKNKLKGVVLEVPENTDVKLAIIAKYNSEKYSTPVVFKAIYNLSPIVENAQLSSVYGFQEQSSFPFSNYYNSYSYISLSNANSQQHYACIIEMKTGFIGNNGFISESYPLTLGLQNGNTTIDVIDYNCEPSILNSMENFEEQVIEKNIASSTVEIFHPIVYPNPSSGLINIESNEHNLIESISVFNTNGQLLVDFQEHGIKNKEIDISNLQSGMYLLKIRTNSKNFFERVIITK